VINLALKTSIAQLLQEQLALQLRGDPWPTWLSFLIYID